jgi:hypothetical protein
MGRLYQEFLIEEKDQNGVVTRARFKKDPYLQFCL